MNVNSHEYQQSLIDQLMYERTLNKMKKYTITLTHDSGLLNITTTASSLKQAVKQVLDYEGAPFGAVVKMKIHAN